MNCYPAVPGGARVVAMPHPLRSDRMEGVVGPGLSVEEILETVQPNPFWRKFARVYVDDKLLPRETWAEARPLPGQTVYIRAVPMGGGGGGSSPVRIVAMLAVMALAWYAAPIIGGYFGAAAMGGMWFGSAGAAVTFGSIMTAVTSGAIMMAGNMLVNALVPPSTPKLAALSGTNSTETQTYSISGGRNSARLYNSFPRVYGKHLIIPPYAAAPYIENKNNDQYLHCLFCVGYGPLEITDVKIGDTPVDDFNGDIDCDVLNGYPNDKAPKYYEGSVYEEQLAVDLKQTDQWVTRTTAADIDRISIDITCPQLTSIDSKGNRQATTVELEAQYRLAGLPDGEGWQAFGKMVDVPAKTLTIPTQWGGYTYVRVNPSNGTIGYDNNGNSVPVEHPSYPLLGYIYWAPVEGYDSECGYYIYDYRPSFTDKRGPLLLDLGADNFKPTFTVLSPGQTGTGSTSCHVSFAAGRAASGGLTLSGATMQPTRITAEIAVPRQSGEPGPAYEVQVRRLTSDSSSDRLLNKTYWSALRVGRTSSPITLPGMAYISVRAKATGRLNGTIDQLSCVAQSILPEWVPSARNGEGAWVEKATANPAAIFRDILCGSMNPRRLDPDLRLDLESLQDWSNECQAAGREFNYVLENKTTILQLLRDVCAAGRASYAVRDSRHGVIQDKRQDSPVQHFTPRNSWGFSAKKAIPDQPHALRVKFINEENSWKQNERIVYADGYNQDGRGEMQAATRFEDLELPGVTNPANATKDARYFMAVAKLRPETYTLNVDWEHLVCTRGDMVRVSHDVLLVGLGWGRVKRVTVNAQNQATGVILDDSVVMEEGKSYCLRIRLGSSAESVLQTLVTRAGETNVLDFQEPLPNQMPEEGDLCQFGKAGQESAEMLITRIEMLDDLAARLVLVDASPAIHDENAKEIPAFEPQISLPADISKALPAIPILGTARSDSSVLIRSGDGTITSRIVVDVRAGVAAGAPPAEAFGAEYREAGVTTPWMSLPPQSASGGQVDVVPVEDGKTYDIRVRSVSHLGLVSEWVYLYGHTVIGKTAPPSNVQGFVYDVKNNGMLLSWSPIADVDADLYEVRLGASWDTAQVLAQTRATTWLWEHRAAGTHHLFVKAIDTSSLYSAVATTLDVVVKAPYQVPGLTAQVIDNNVLLSWEPPLMEEKSSLPIAGYEIRRGASWEGANKSFGLKSGTFTTIFEDVAGSYAYWVAPVDVAGNMGAPRSVSAVVSQPPDYILRDDQYLDPALCTLTNAIIEGEAILAPVNMAETFQDHFSSRSWATPQAQVDAGHGLFIQPANETGQIIKEIDYEVILPGTMISVSWMEDSVAGGATITPVIQTKALAGDDWTTYAGVNQVFSAGFRYLRVTLDVTSNDVKKLVRISSIRVKLDVKLKNDSGMGYAMATDSGGSVVDFNVSFIDVSSITVTSAAGGSAVYAIYDFTDVPNPTSFKVLLFDRNGVRQSGTFSWSAKGC